jgi:Xaa-Pro aminopeptidase
MQESAQIEKITPSAEIEARITKLRQALAEKGVDAALIIQKSDLFYFGSTSQQGWLYVPVSGTPLLFVFKSFERAVAESPLADIHSLSSPKKIPQMLADLGYPEPSTLGLELDVLPTNLYFQYQKIFGSAAIVDLSLPIRLIRAVKSEYEIGLISAAAAMSDKVAAKVPELVEEGKSEVEIAGELEGYARSLGHQGLVRMRMWGSELFYGHLMSGAAAAVPSYLASPTGGEGVSPSVAQGAGFKTIKRDEPILVDYVFALNGYMSDHARIFCLGRLSDALLRAHNAMLGIQQEIKTMARPGVRSGELYDFMADLAGKMGYGENFMGVGDRKIRFTGHGIGLELDEFPFLAKGQELPLEAGMIIALEPKIIIPGVGVVGIENTHVVREDGLETLTKYPDSITTI